MRVSVTDLGENTEQLQLLVDGEVVSGVILSRFGESVTIAVPDDSTVSVRGETTGGEQSVIRSITVDSGSLSSGMAPSIVSSSGGALTSEPQPEPTDLAAIHSNMSGSGTASDPYIITNSQELQAMNYDLSAHYKLGNNIDASNTSDWGLLVLTRLEMIQIGLLAVLTVVGTKYKD